MEFYDYQISSHDLDISNDSSELNCIAINDNKTYIKANRIIELVKIKNGKITFNGIELNDSNSLKHSGRFYIDLNEFGLKIDVINDIAYVDKKDVI